NELSFAMLKEFLDAVRHRRAWRPMRTAIANAMISKFDYGDYKKLDRANLWLVPTDRATLLKHTNRDLNGRPDNRDRFFSVSLPLRHADSKGYDPLEQALPAAALQGRPFNRAVDRVALALRYEKGALGVVPARIGWTGGVVPAGFVEPRPGENNAFDFA